VTIPATDRRGELRGLLYETNRERWLTRSREQH
jgi:hypothetical protein